MFHDRRINSRLLLWNNEASLEFTALAGHGLYASDYLREFVWFYFQHWRDSSTVSQAVGVAKLEDGLRYAMWRDVQGPHQSGLIEFPVFDELAFMAQFVTQVSVLVL